MTSAIDLSRLPAPEVIAQLDFEAIFAGARADLVARHPEAAEVLALESEPLVKLLQAGAYRELLVRAAANDQARGCMLAYAWGGTLDHLAALLGVARLTIDPGDPGAVPPVPPVLEADDDLRRRAQLAPEAMTPRGTAGMYRARALGADGGVRDAEVVPGLPGQVIVHVLGRDGDGTPAQAVLDAVAAALEDGRVLGDVVTVQGAAILPYAVAAELTLAPGPAEGLVLDAARAGLRAYRDRVHALGHDVTISALHAALHVAGVTRVALAAPVADVVAVAGQAPWCADADLVVTVAEARDV
ncbi:MAG: baseplate assembly protein [Paracoccaceae bacterium]